jgi:radical SAM protein with 4Fe4S-binding SPASM domain
MTGDKPLPKLFVQVHITNACNLRCSHCYMGNSGSRYMPADLFEKLLAGFEEMCAAIPHGAHSVQITGGEPLLHPDWPGFLQRANRSVGKVFVMTNGSLVDAAAARELARWCDGVQVSLDGLEPMHDRLRAPGSYQTTLAAIDRLRAAGIFTVVKMTVTRKNQCDVLPLFESLRERISLYSASCYVPTGPDDTDLLPDPRLYRAVMGALFSLWEAGAPVSLSDPAFGRLLSVTCPDACYSGCSAGRNGLTIMENGDILPCRRLAIPLGNLADHGLLATLRDHPIARQLRARRLKEPCGSCPHLHSCGGSRCVAWAVTRDLDAADPLCLFSQGHGAALVKRGGLILPLKALLRNRLPNSI